MPWYAPEKNFEAHPLSTVETPPVKEDDLTDIPPIGKELAAKGREDFEKVLQADKWKEAVQAYRASISFADSQIGRLLDALDQHLAKDNTIIILWSDHGFHLGEKKHWHKSTLWERATRVPFIIIAPNVTRPGTQSAEAVSLLDIYPTLNELCQLPPLQNLDGQSLVPLLQNPEMSWEKPALITYHRGNHAIRDERWRYIRYHDGTQELYDHANDPHEWNNLALSQNYASVIDSLRQWLPEKNAPEALGKKNFEFDYATYTWKRK